MHFRYILEKGKPVLSFEKIIDRTKIYSNGGLTIAIEKDDDEIYFGACKCSLKDTYNKKYGRIRSYGISKSSIGVSVYDDGLDNIDIDSICVTIAKHVHKYGIVKGLQKVQQL